MNSFKVQMLLLVSLLAPEMQAHPGIARICTNTTIEHARYSQKKSFAGFVVIENSDDQPLQEIQNCWVC